MTGSVRGPVVGLVLSEPISDPLIEQALDVAGLPCVRLDLPRGRLVTLRHLLGCDMVLKSFGAYSAGYFRLFAIARGLGKKVVLYWIGSDVLYAASTRVVWARRIQRLVAANLTVTAGLADELGALGVRAQVVPIVSDLAGVRVQPLPARFTVLTYLPDHDHAFYGSEAVSELVRRLADVHFLVVGGWREDAPLPNLECLGFVSDMAPVYLHTSVLLRLTPHDGLPKMVLEALAYGRQVIWSQPFPRCRLARNRAEAETAILDGRACVVPNHEGAAYVQAHHGFPAFASALRDRLQEASRA